MSEGVVWRFRKALGVGQWEPEGSRRLHQETSRRGAAAVRGRDFSDQEREERRRRARELGLRPPQRPGGRSWTGEELALLADLPDAEVARRTGRTPEAVRQKRRKLAGRKEGRSRASTLDN